MGIFFNGSWPFRGGRERRRSWRRFNRPGDIGSLSRLGQWRWFVSHNGGGGHRLFARLELFFEGGNAVFQDSELRARTNSFSGQAIETIADFLDLTTYFSDLAPGVL